MWSWRPDMQWASNVPVGLFSLVFNVLFFFFIFSENSQNKITKKHEYQLEAFFNRSLHLTIQFK